MPLRGWEPAQSLLYLMRMRSRIRRLQFLKLQLIRTLSYDSLSMLNPRKNRDLVPVLVPHNHIAALKLLAGPQHVHDLLAFVIEDRLFRNEKHVLFFTGPEPQIGLHPQAKLAASVVHFEYGPGRPRLLIDHGTDVDQPAMEFLVRISGRRKSRVDVLCDPPKVFLEDGRLHPHLVQRNDLEDRLTGTDFLSHGLFNFNHRARNRSSDVVIRCRWSGLQCAELFLYRGEIGFSSLPVGLGGLELTLRICLLFEQAPRAFGLRRGYTQPGADFDFSLCKPPPFRIEATVLNADLRGLRGCWCLYECRQDLAACNVLSDSRKSSALDNAADRRSYQRPIRRRGDDAARGINLRQRRCFFGHGELQPDQPLLFHPEGNDSIRFSRRTGRYRVPLLRTIPHQHSGHNQYDDDACRQYPFHGRISFPTANSSSLTLT